MTRLKLGASQNGTPGSPRLLDLRPAPRGSSRAVDLDQASSGAGPDAHIEARGSWISLMREAGRLAKASVLRLFSLQNSIETAFLASGAAVRLADAALEGEPTKELAGRIASIARDLANAAGATVHLRTQDGLQSLASSGEPSSATLATRALQTGLVEWNDGAAAVPLRVRERMVGALSIKF